MRRRSRVGSMDRNGCREAVAGVGGAPCKGCVAQAPAPSPAQSAELPSSHGSEASPAIPTSRCDTRWQAARDRKERQHRAARCVGDRAKHPNGQAIFHHHRYIRGVVADYSAKWAVCGQDAVRSVCRGVAGGRPERDRSRDQTLTFPVIAVACVGAAATTGKTRRSGGGRPEFGSGGNSSTGGHRAAKPQPHQLAGRGYRNRLPAGTVPVKRRWRGVALDRRQLGLRRRFGRHQRDRLVK